MHVEQLFIYPLKSARGIGLPFSSVTPFGLDGDRRAMLVDESGYFITQREEPRLATLSVQSRTDGLRLSVDDRFDIVARAGPNGKRLDVVVWKSIVDAALADEESSDVLSSWLGRRVHLVFFDNGARRLASAEWAGQDSPVTFADGYQILVTTTASLAALNAELASFGEGAIGMERFRPNIVIDTDEAWAEDGWASIDIGGIRFDLVKPCARCIMTTQDQTTGSREVANPMPAMGRIRMSGDRRVPGPLFGWNATPRGGGTIHPGDRVAVVEDRMQAWPFKTRRTA